MILICVGGRLAPGCLVAPFPTWRTGAKTISPEYIFDCSLFNQRGSVCTGTSWGSAGTVGVALMGGCRRAGRVSCSVAGAVVSGAYFGDKISPLSDSTNFAAIVARHYSVEHIQHCFWTTLPSFLLAAVVLSYRQHSSQYIRAGNTCRSALRTSSTRWSRYTILILFLFCRR